MPSFITQSMHSVHVFVMYYYSLLVVDQLQMVLPLDVDFLVSSGLSVPEHNQQLLEMMTGGAAIVIPAWEPAVGSEAGQQAATDAVLGKLVLPGSACPTCRDIKLYTIASSTVAVVLHCHEKRTSEQTCEKIPVSKLPIHGDLVSSWDLRSLSWNWLLHKVSARIQ